MNKRAASKNTIADRILALLADGKPRTSAEIARAIDANLRRVDQLLKVAREPGGRQQLHAADRGGQFNSVRYVIGPGENNYSRPAAIVRSAEDGLDKDRLEGLTDAQLDAKYRGQWRWPKVDAVVLRSIDAMVRMGARA